MSGPEGSQIQQHFTSMAWRAILEVWRDLSLLRGLVHEAVWPRGYHTWVVFYLCEQPANFFWYFTGAAPSPQATGHESLGAEAWVGLSCPLGGAEMWKQQEIQRTWLWEGFDSPGRVLVMLVSTQGWGKGSLSPPLRASSCISSYVGWWRGCHLCVWPLTNASRTWWKSELTLLRGCRQQHPYSSFFGNSPQWWVAGVATPQGTVTVGTYPWPLSGLQWTLPRSSEDSSRFLWSWLFESGRTRDTQRGDTVQPRPRRGPLDRVVVSLQEGRSHLQPRGSPSTQPRGDSVPPDRDTSCDCVTWTFIKSTPWGVRGEHKETKIEKLLANRSGRRKPQQHRGLGQG